MRTRKALHGLRFNAGNCPVRVSGPSLLHVTSPPRTNGPTAAANDLEGGTVAGPRRCFHALAEFAAQNSSSHGHPKSLTSPTEMVGGRFSRLGNWESIVYTTQASLFWDSSCTHFLQAESRADPVAT